MARLAGYRIVDIGKLAEHDRFRLLVLFINGHAHFFICRFAKLKVLSMNACPTEKQKCCDGEPFFHSAYLFKCHLILFTYLSLTYQNDFLFISTVDGAEEVCVFGEQRF